MALLLEESRRAVLVRGGTAKALFVGNTCRTPSICRNGVSDDGGGGGGANGGVGGGCSSIR